MEKLPHWRISDKFPALYDLESATAIEQTAKVYGAMQTLIEEYNSYVTALNAQINAFEKSTNTSMESFKKCITDITSNYIQALDTRMSVAENYMKTNIEETSQNLLNEAIRLGKISIEEVYDDTTESLNMVVTGEV
jgi:wobble nucleotide-excising tRNase